MDNLRVLRTVIIGDQATGKSILSCLITGVEPSKDYVSTIGVEYLVRRFTNENFIIHIWDISGSERFESIIKVYIPKGRLILLVYSLDNYKSLIHAKKLYWKYTKENIFKADKIIIVANKSDLAIDQLENAGKIFAEQINADHISISCKKKQGLKQLLNMMTSILPPPHPLLIKHIPSDNKGLKKYCCTLL